MCLHGVFIGRVKYFFFFRNKLEKQDRLNGMYVLIGRKYILHLNICYVETDCKDTRDVEVCGKPLQMQIPPKSPGAMLKGLLQELITACFDYR